MSKAAITRMLQGHQAAIARQELVLSHTIISDVLRTLAEGSITEGQALTVLGLIGERVSPYGLDHVALYRAAIGAIHQMQAEEQ